MIEQIKVFIESTLIFHLKILSLSRSSQAPTMTEISKTTAIFHPITLAQMDEVKLMNRTDRKYWFHRDQITEVLRAVADRYYMLEVNGERILPYTTTYYDTEQNAMFAAHHRGKSNRYKIRRRCYVSTQSSFLEVKFKNNKGRTIKSRHTSSYANSDFDSKDREFISNNTPYSCDSLRQILETQFCRLTLVSKGMNERCTIDLDLHFKDKHRDAEFKDVIIVEVKTDGRSKSTIIEALNRQRIKPSGFSKYCVGRSLLDSDIKQNLFKQKLRKIATLTNNTK